MIGIREAGRLVSGSMNRRIMGAAVLVGAMTLGVKTAAMYKEMLVASNFGTGDQLDAFLIGFMLPGYVVSVVAGSLNAALIPVQVNVTETQGREAASRLFSGTVLLSGALLVAATVLLAISGKALVPWLCVGFVPAKIQLAERYFYLCLPTVALGGLITVWESGLNAGERFGWAALAPVMVPLTTIFLLSMFGHSYGADTLAGGLAIGSILQLVVLAIALRKQGVDLLPRWHGWEPGIKRVARQYASLAASAALICSNVVIDQVMASSLPPGSVSALNFGNKLVAVILTVGTMALGTAVLPYFSKAAAVGDWAGLRHTLRTYSRLVVLVSIPVVLAGLFLSRPLVHILFERGHFTAADSSLVARIQGLYFLQVPFYALTILFVRMISSLEANHLLIAGTVLSISLNVLLNWLLMSWLGVEGIALSTSVTQMALSGFTGAMVYSKLGRIKRGGQTCA